MNTHFLLRPGLRRVLMALLILQLTPLEGLCQDPSGGLNASGDQPSLTRAWIEAGQVVSEDDPTWDQLRAELDKGFARSLEAGLTALTNDLTAARRQFVIAARMAEEAGRREQEQAQWGLDYVDALLTMRRASTFDGFTSSWARVQETEAVLPVSWPRVGTNLAVQVVQTRARTALEETRRAEAIDPLDADLAGLEVAVGLRKPGDELVDPVTGRPAARLVAGVDAQWYFRALERLEGDFERMNSLTPERRKALQQVQRRLQLFPGAY